MKMIHSAITSALFKWVTAVEIDLCLGANTWTTRIELWQDMQDMTRFRCRFLEAELFRLTPSFPRDAQDQPAHMTDDKLFVERGFPGQTATLHPFRAADVDEAIMIALDDLKRFLEHTTGEAVQ